MRWKLGKKPFPPPFLIPRAGLVTQAEVKGTTSTVYEATSPTFFSIQKMDAHFQEAGKCLWCASQAPITFFSQLEGQVSTSRGKNEPKTASLSKYLPNKKTRPTFAYFTHFLHFYLAHLLLCCVLFCRAFPRAYLWWEDPSFSTIVMRFFRWTIC